MIQMPVKSRNFAELLISWLFFQQITLKTWQLLLHWILSAFFQLRLRIFANRSGSKVKKKTVEVSVLWSVITKWQLEFNLTTVSLTLLQHIPSLKNSRKAGSSMIPVDKPFKWQSHHLRHSFKWFILGPGEESMGHSWDHGPINARIGHFRCSSIRNTLSV